MNMFLRNGNPATYEAISPSSVRGYHEEAAHTAKFVMRKNSTDDAITRRMITEGRAFLASILIPPIIAIDPYTLMSTFQS